ncbi:RNA polymerase sigma factor [Planctomicrobium sp. SH668]|uniref:RNA polymerase sigma factor n=1 Tax=Planctomicrobium sp. SH668 TaxID=3448126 RepID=UPI003F5BA0CC
MNNEIVTRTKVELAQRCLIGEAGAVREFVDMYYQPVFVLCLRMLRHQQDAEDTTQESLVRALRYLKSWDDTQPLTPWVLKIAANRCRTNLGKRGKFPSQNEFVVEIIEASHSTASFGLGEELELALETLNAEQRRCFCLFYQQDKSIAEIALIMEMPEGTVKTWLHRCRKQLAQRLRERGISPNRKTVEN